MKRLGLLAIAVGLGVCIAGPQRQSDKQKASRLRTVSGHPGFVLEARSPEPYTPTYVGNGELGLASSVPGTAGTDCFVAGLYDHAPGDISRIARAPAWNEVDVYNGADWLNRTVGSGAALRAYRQTLDMYDGTLRTEYEWPGAGRSIRIAVQSFVSRARPEIGAVRLEVTPQADSVIRVSLPLREWPALRRYLLDQITVLQGEANNQQVIWYPGRMAVSKWRVSSAKGQGLISAQSHSEGRNTPLFEAVALRWPANLDSAQVTTPQEPDSRSVQISFRGKRGRTYVFYKYAALMPSFGGADIGSDAEDRAREAAALGFDALAEESARAWHALWESDIVVEGDPTLQTTIHSMLFYLLASARPDSDFSVPPMGLATSGYYGHFFWDADTYMMPPLLMLHPEIAKPMIMFRSRTLDAARANARNNNYRGAMYPWEASPDGVESTPRFAYQNALYENHVNAAVALAAWQWYLATGDRDWLSRYGYPMIRDTADFWVSRVNYNQAMDRYEISHVVAVKESDIGVNNEPYTNAAAKKNLELATEAARTLGAQPNPEWAAVAAKMYLPSMQAMLIDYPLEYPLTADQRRAIAHEALAHPPEGVMMGSEFEPILGAELADRKLIDDLLPRTWQSYARPPFDVLTETPTNDNYNFITGAGAFLHQFLFGYSGLRLTEKGLEQKYAPMLPGSISRLTLKGVTVRGARRDFAFNR